MLKFLLIFISVIYLGGLIGKWFLRNWIGKMAKQQNQQQTTQQEKKEGEVTVDYNATSRKKRNQGEGEYVDFEDVN